MWKGGGKWYFVTRDDGARWGLFTGEFDLADLILILHVVLMYLIMLTIKFCISGVVIL